MTINNFANNKNHVRENVAHGMVLWVDILSATRKRWDDGWGRKIFSVFHRATSNHS